MSLPEVPYQERDGQRLIAQFGGINYRASAQENEYAEARNVSTEFWPRLSPRGRRSVQGTYGSPTALFAWDKLVIVDGTDLLYDGEVVAQVTPGEKQFAVVNTKLIVWPDGIWIDLVNKDTRVMAARLESLDGETTIVTANSVTMKTFHNYGEKSCILERYSLRSGQANPSRISYTTLYKSVSFDSGTQTWTLGDAMEVTWSNMGNAYADGYRYAPLKDSNAGTYVVNTRQDERPESGPDFPIRFYGPWNTEGYYLEMTDVGRIEQEQGWAANEFFFTVHNTETENMPAEKVFDVGDALDIMIGTETVARKAVVSGISTSSGTSTITFKENVLTPGTEEETVTLLRNIPPFDYICESKNRLWGVCNAQQAERWNPTTEEYETVTSRVICGSELGEPTRFWTFEGLATDSYQTAVSSAGDFTGITGYGDDVLAFKEHKIYRLTGDYPAEYYLYDWDMAGVQEGCHKSIQVINEVLYYKARNGVCAFTGTAPQYISYPLGTDHYFEAVAGSDKLNYYVSMEDEKGVRKLYVYDTTHGIWSVEDAERVTDFAWAGGKLYLLIGRNIYISETPTLAIEARTYTVPEGGLAAGDYKAVLGTERGFTLSGALAEGAVLRWAKPPENVYSEPETGFVSGKLYAVSGETVTEIPLTDPDDEATELTFTNADYTVTAEPVEWSATFRQWDEDILERKDYRWLRLRFRLEEGSTMTVSGAPDHGALQELATYTEAGEHVTEIPLLPMRGDCFTVRIDGTGECAVKALRRDIMVGSDKV